MIVVTNQMAEQAAELAKASQAETDDFLDATVLKGICRKADATKHPDYVVTLPNGTEKPFKPLYVKLTCKLPEPVHYKDELGEAIVSEAPTFFHINGKKIQGGDTCKWGNDKTQNAERSFYYLNLIGWDFADEHAVEGKPVRVKIGRDDKGRIVFDMCTHEGAQHDTEASDEAAEAAEAWALQNSKS